MFEVLVTYRPDFSERVLARFQTEQEARDAAQRFAGQNQVNVIRTRIRS